MARLVIRARLRDPTAMRETSHDFNVGSLTAVVAKLIDRCATGTVDRGALAEIAEECNRMPRNPMPLYRLATALRRSRHIDLWHATIAVASEYPHRTHEQLCARADAKLLLGDWAGWRDRESRFFNPSLNYFQSEEVRTLRWSKKTWDGVEGIGDKTLLIVADGSPEDRIQMLRFVPWAAECANKLLLAVSLDVLQLAQQQCGHIATVLFRDMPHAIPYQRYAWLMSMPSLCGQLPRFTPFVKTVPVGAHADTDVHPVRLGLLCDDDRAAPDGLTIEVLGKHLERTDIQWQLLQPASSCLPGHLAMTPAPPCVDTLSDLARVLTELDGIVCVDGVAAHLAGSFGLPTWLMLRFVADPRWALGETTPWYPSMRILRQPASGDWAVTTGKLATELEVFARERRPDRVTRQAGGLAL
jgi:hypothetical protein